MPFVSPARSRDDPTLLNDFEMATEGNGDPLVLDLRTIEELCQPSFNGRGDDANKHLDKFLHVTQSIKVNGVIDDALRLGLTLRHRDTFNAAAGGTFMKRPLKVEMAEINKNLMRIFQVNQQVKAVTPKCETCGGPHSYNDCPATVGQTQKVYAAGAYQGGNSYQPQGRNQFFRGASHGPNPPPAYQAPSYPAPVHQPSIPQSQVMTTTEFTNYMQENDAILKNMQTNMTSLINSNLELKNMFGQFMKMNTASSLGSGTLLSNTITNSKEDLKVERKTEVTNDMVHPTNNGSTKDVQPLVVQVETLMLNYKPVISPIIEPIAAPVSALKPN
nr:hypothetical protein [Tanacetum cinerariifolium]